MRPYYHLFHQEQPGVFNQMCHKGYFNNWNIIQLSQKSTPSVTFDEIHQVVLDGISDNMASLVESGKYGAINTIEKITHVFYVIMFK